MLKFYNVKRKQTSCLVYAVALLSGNKWIASKVSSELWIAFYPYKGDQRAIQFEPDPRQSMSVAFWIYCCNAETWAQTFTGWRDSSWRLRLKCDGTRAETRFRLSANGRVHLNRQVSQFSRLLAAEVCVSAVVMLGTPCSVVVWRVLATHSIRQFPIHFPSRASPCAITFQLDSTEWARSHRTPRQYAPQTQFKFTQHSTARSTM